MRSVGHGGACCGVFHIAGFGPPRALTRDNEGSGRYRWNQTIFKNLVAKFEKRPYVNSCPSRGERGKLLEVILTDTQVQNMPKWPSLLKEQGFRLVTRFLNSSGGWCNVFHKTTGNCGDDNIPDWWKD